MDILNDTIAAISTPVGKSGIGIVRLSGRGALAIAEKIFVSSGGLSPSEFPSHKLYYGWIADNSDRIDEVLLNVMRAPRTYTKEDIVEINCHSGIVVLKRILELVLKRGARLASPGEFTKRAYLNGRIDLTQAEAVLDVINSQTGDALKAALGQLQGRVSQKINALRKKLMDVLIQLELSIDFSDQDIQPESPEVLLKNMDAVFRDLKELLDSAEQGTMLREGISCAICGKPNVGKSSLLNAFLKRDRAIVTPIPGTTRDVLEETIDLAGIPLRLLDTAGIIRGRDLATKEAVKSSRICIKAASLVLFVLDAAGKITSEDYAISRSISQKPAFVVLNKQDLAQRISVEQAQRLFPGRKVVGISALRGTGLERLEKEVADYIWQGKAGSFEQILITNVRHKQALEQAQKFLKRAIQAVKKGQSAEIIALEIKQTQEYLAEIIGKISCTDILERIFSQFCIGK